MNYIKLTAETCDDIYRGIKKFTSEVNTGRCIIKVVTLDATKRSYMYNIVSRVSLLKGLSTPLVAEPVKINIELKNGKAILDQLQKLFGVAKSKYNLTIPNGAEIAITLNSINILIEDRHYRLELHRNKLTEHRYVNMAGSVDLSIEELDELMNKTVDSVLDRNELIKYICGLPRERQVSLLSQLELMNRAIFVKKDGAILFKWRSEHQIGKTVSELVDGYTIDTYTLEELSNGWINVSIGDGDTVTFIFE